MTRHQGHTVADLAGYFLGAWAFERWCRDRRGGPDGHMIGTARFTPSAEGLDYEEAGVLSIGATRVEGGQAYRYDLAPDGARAMVRFPDGREFHPLSLETGYCRAVHPCGPDLYRGLIAVTAPDRWCTSWWVTGPRKALRIASRYQRLRAMP